MSMRRSPPHFRRAAGAVLLLVLGAVAILSILAVELAHRANVDVFQSARTAREASFRRAIDSGLEIAKALIIEGRKSRGFDVTSDPWSRKTEVMVPSTGHITVQIADESGKINVLKAIGDDSSTLNTRRSLARVFAYLRKAEPAREKQWQDVESAVWKRLGIGTIPAGDAKSTEAPLYTLDGLREAGVPLEFVFGLDPDAKDKCWTLSDVLTTFGDGRINLNTAPAPVLYALDEEYDESLVGQIETWRGKPSLDAETENHPFRNANDLEQIEGIVQKQIVNDKPQIVRNLFTKVQDRVGVQSKCFSVRVNAKIENRGRIAWGFIEINEMKPGSLSAGTFKILALEEIEP